MPSDFTPHQQWADMKPSSTNMKLLPVHYFTVDYAEFHLFFLLTSLSILEDSSGIPLGQPLPLLAGIISKYHHVTVIPFLGY